MKPITPLQKMVVRLSATLPPITAEQVADAGKKCTLNYAKLSRSKLHCLECGHSWKPEKKAEVLEYSTCPECHKNMLIIKVKGAVKECRYYGILTTREGVQVIRIFRIDKTGNIGKPNQVECYEVMQHWITDKGERVTMSKTVNGFSFNVDDWIKDSTLEIRKPSMSFRRTTREHLSPTQFWKVRKILPIIKRNGYKGVIGLIPLYQLFTTLITDHRAEQLMKAGQISLLQHRISTNAKEDMYWNTVRVCIRHGYIVEDATMFYDYIKLLERFGKDILNPHYICPENLKKEHDRYVDKKRLLDRRRKYEEQRAQIEADQKQYEREKGKYFDVELGDKEIQIGVLRHVKDFLDEGEILQHCVFSNEYYKEKNSLILSARKGNERLETIEISLSSLKVLQARGKRNDLSTFHDRILDLVNKNIGKVARRRKSQNKQKITQLNTL